MDGTIAITDHGWYERLVAQPGLDEVNFWKPTATRAFRAPEYSPFLFKLRAEHGHAICGFGLFARYARLPDWLAWETFGLTIGCASLEEMRARIGGIRHRIRFAGRRGVDEIGSILILQPTFFPRPLWVAGPRDWKDRTQTPMRYDLSAGEGARVWQECLAAAGRLGAARDPVRAGVLGGPRFGTPTLVRPRLGQGTFRIAVMDAYGRRVRSQESTRCRRSRRRTSGRSARAGRTKSGTACFSAPTCTASSTRATSRSTRTPTSSSAIA